MMLGKTLVCTAAAALVLAAGSASAEDRLVLADAQLDAVTAGSFNVRKNIHSNIHANWRLNGSVNFNKRYFADHYARSRVDARGNFAAAVWEAEALGYNTVTEADVKTWSVEHFGSGVAGQVLSGSDGWRCFAPCR